MLHFLHVLNRIFWTLWNAYERGGYLLPLYGPATPPLAPQSPIWYNSGMRTLNDTMPPPVAVEYAREVRNRLGPHARQIILFGSQERGDATERSDYDFVVVVDERTRELRNLVSDAGAEMLGRVDALCAALVYDGGQWAEVLESPLGWNIDREGIRL